MYWLWNPDPVAFTIGNLAVGWYGILFALGFLFAQRLVIFMYRKEGKPDRDLDALLIYLIVGTVVGARLGHCVFYDPLFYLRNPLRMLMVWEGGLASHGATAGLLIACFIFSRRKKDQPFFWLVDRIAIVAALVGTLVRLGNFVNAEIVGTPTDAPYGVVFLTPIRDVILGSGAPIIRMDAQQTTTVQPAPPGIVPLLLSLTPAPGTSWTAEQRALLENTLLVRLHTDPASRIHIVPAKTADVPQAGSLVADDLSMTVPAIARHPVQLYEAAVYGTLFVLLFGGWWKHRAGLRHGVLLGRLLVILFSARFVLEYVKEHVAPMEGSLPFTLGQLLSVPFVLFGAWLLLKLKSPSQSPTPVPPP